MPSLNLKYNREPICPYCGEVQSDAWELNLETDGAQREVDCLKCELPFTVQLNLTSSYNSYALKEKVLAICEKERIAIPESLTGIQPEGISR